MRNSVAGLLVLASVALAGCGGGSGESAAPTGQVVATVGEEEITLRELNLELRGINAPDEEAMKAAQQSAVTAIANRKLLARSARDQGLDDSGDFQLVRQRAEEILLAQAVQRQSAASIKRPTRQEAQQFINQHPDMYGQRKIFVLDQIKFASADNKALIQSMQGLNTADEVEQRLLGAGIKYQRAPAALDARTTPPELVAQIAFGEWTREGRLRHPRFLGLRDDKPAREVVRERPS